MIAEHYSTLEARRQSVQSALDASRSSAERNRLGQFATPNALALDIARYAGTLIEPGSGGIRFADPSIGSGSFYSAALAALGAERLEHAIGVELDPAIAAAAGELWSDTGLHVVCGDFTRIVADDSCPPAPNLILANPPYVRHHHIGRTDKERLHRLVYRMTGIEVHGLAGMYVYFLLLATAWMEEGGYAAWLIPSEFMDVNYGVALKRYLTDRVTLLRVHRFDPDNVQFGDALVSSVVVVLKKSPPLPGHQPQFSFGGTLGTPHTTEDVTLDRLRASIKWTAFAGRGQNGCRGLGLHRGPTLSDYFRIQRGIATGDNKFFILDRTEAEKRRLPAKYLRPILPSPRHLKATVVEADDDGYPILDRGLCVIDCDLPEDVVKCRHPALWEYLRTAEVLGVRNGYLVAKRTPWYRQEQRKPCPFLCTYMGRGTDDKRPFRFIHNRSLATATNLYLMLYPQKGLADMLRMHPARASDVHALLSGVTGSELRSAGRVYGGGLNKIEPSELGRISAASFVEHWPELVTSVRSTETAGLFD